MKIAQIETAIDSYHAHHSKSAVQREVAPKVSNNLSTKAQKRQSDQ